MGTIKITSLGRAAIIALLCAAYSTAIAQNWQLKKDEDGIQVFTAATPNSNFKSIKVECTVKTKATQLIAFLMDIAAQHDWVYNNKNTSLVKRISPTEMIFYSEVSVPWPCTNRDYISHITVLQPSPQLITIDARSEPDLIPKKQGTIRVINSKAHWDVTRLTPELLKIVYTVEFDPAGSVPPWLINMFITKGPFETFEKLREGVAKPAYANARVDYIKEL